MNDIRNYIKKVLNEAFIDSSGKLNDFQLKKEKIKFITYPINGINTKFQVASKNLYPFTGKDSSLDTILPGYIVSDEQTQIVQVQFTYLIKFVKLGENIYMLNDVNEAYNKFFNSDNDSSGEEMKEKNTKYIELFRSYILENLKTYNHNKLVEQLFNLLDDTGYNFVYFDDAGMNKKYKYGKYQGYEKQIPYVMK